MDGSRIRTLGRRPAIDVLSREDLERVHSATLDVLETTGLEVGSARVLGLLAEAGAKIDPAARRVRFPGHMVEAAVEAAPRDFLLAARDPAADVIVDGSRGYLSLDGCAAEVVDLDTGARRPPTRDDLRKATILADATPEVAYLWPCVAVTDVPPEAQASYQTLIQLVHSSKHVSAMATYSERDARIAVEMATVVAGSAEALRARPIVSTFQCSLSPLMYDEGPIEAALAFAEAGLPCGFVAMAIGTAGAPTTLAGHLVSLNAELLGGITILETLVPGAPTYYGPYEAFMDLMSGGIGLAWGPEDVLFKLAAAQLARRYDLPMNIIAFGTGAKTQDWQAGAQHALSLMGVLASGDVDLVSATGTIYGSRVFAFENVLLDAELWDIAARILEGFPVSEDLLAVDVIEAVGPAGHFLDQDHTLAHMRERWRARFFGSESWEAWEAAGRPEPKDRARDRAREIVATHEPLPLPEDVERELHAIAARTTGG
ncbi:MAG: trimethylamine methyltransferase family protein [Actinobacteria bacterium]|nr:trimethylamine methyltransferase family protein [Actinomycetota bacterium]